MKTPYEILGVSKGANDDAIKQAYLHQVKKFPPERDSEKFQLINQAYAAIKDHKSRLRQELFDLPTADFDLLLDQALKIPTNVQISPEQFKQLLSAGLDEANLLNALADHDQR